MSAKEPDSSLEPESRSERKRQMLALQKIGEVLVDLPDAQLAMIPLEGALADAIALARTITAHEGKRRQLQYIGKLMRDVDPEPIVAALEKIQLKDQRSKAKFHQIERWRDKLIAEGDKKLENFIKQFPQTDSQRLRTLIRRAQQDNKANRISSAETELFRYLREVIEDQS